MKALYAVALLLSLFFVQGTQRGTRSLVLTHVTLVDVTEDQPIKALKVDQYVVITGNYLAIVDEAKKQKLPVAGHVPLELTAAEISDAGQSSIEHVNDLFISVSPNEKELRYELRRIANLDSEVTPRIRVELKAASSFEEKRSKSLFARFVNNGTWQCPTLGVKCSNSRRQ